MGDADIDKSVADGAKIGGEIGVAGAAAIGLLIGAAVPPPFDVMAAPIGAALGAMIGFFVGLAHHGPSPAELARAHAAHEKAVNAAALTGHVLWTSSQYLLGFLQIHLALVTDPATRVAKAKAWIATSPNADNLKRLKAQEPAYGPMVDALFAGLLNGAANPGSGPAASLKKVVDFVSAFKSLPGQLGADPFAYLRPPMSSIMGPALAAAGIDINNPATIAILQGNYDFAAAAAARAAAPRKGMTIPIARRSLGLASGGRIATDTRAFSRLAPYGVASYAVAPESAPGPTWRGDNGHGSPLRAPWPYGLDGDRFALPPSAPAMRATAPTGQTTSALVPLGLGALALLLL